MLEHAEVPPEQPLVLGVFGAPVGVRGWLRVQSHTQPREALSGYQPLWLRIAGRLTPLSLKCLKRQGKHLVAELDDIANREQAERLKGAEIVICRSILPALSDGEGYYWTDLIGLQVVTTDEQTLGTVDYLFDTGANDVIVVTGERERLIPWVRPEVVKSVDLSLGRIVVDWDPEF